MPTAKIKYDWQELKLSFFESSYQEVKGFFEDKYGTYNGRIREKTTGWAKEKEEWQRKITQKALLELQKKRSESLAANLDMVLIEMQRRTYEPHILRNMKMKDLKALWEIMRCENGLSTRIIYNHQQTENIDLEEARKSLIEKINVKA